MTDEMKDEAKVEVNLEEMQRSINEMRDKVLELERELAAAQARLEIITANSDASTGERPATSSDTLFRIVADADASTDSDKNRHLRHYSNSLIMRKTRSRGATQVLIAPPLARDQAEAQSGQPTLIVSYLTHQMLKS